MNFLPIKKLKSPCGSLLKSSVAFLVFLFHYPRPSWQKASFENKKSKQELIQKLQQVLTNPLPKEKKADAHLLLYSLLGHFSSAELEAMLSRLQNPLERRYFFNLFSQDVKEWISSVKKMCEKIETP